MKQQFRTAISSFIIFIFIFTPIFQAKAWNPLKDPLETLGLVAAGAAAVVATPILVVGGAAIAPILLVAGGTLVAYDVITDGNFLGFDLFGKDKSPEEKIKGIYEKCLGREPEEGAIEFNMKLLREGTKIDELAYAICNSEEAKNKAEAGADDSSPSETFLWKPKSDSDGKLVVLLPSSMRGQVVSVAVQKNGETLDIGRFSGDTHNGMRPHFRFPKAGGDYGSDLQLVTMGASGACSFAIPNGAKRTEGVKPACGTEAALTGGAMGEGALGEGVNVEEYLSSLLGESSTPEICQYGEKTTALSKNIKLMVMGDSNTSGTGNPPGETTSSKTIGYRKYLKDDLTASGFTVDFVGAQCSGASFMSDCQHEGYPGRGIAQLQSRVNSGAIRSFKPDVVTLLIGSNDMWISLENRSPISSSLAQTRVSDLGKLIDSIHKDAPDAQIIVAKPATPSSAKGPLGIYRNGIDTLASTRSYVKVVDFAGFSNDGTHYRPAGFEKIAASFTSAIKEGRTVCNDAPASTANATTSTSTTSSTATTTSSTTNTNELVISCEISDKSIEVGEETEISVDISGGTSPYKVRWSGDTSKIKKIGKTKESQDIEFKKSGKYVLEVKVTDNNDVSVEEICSTITVYEKNAVQEEEAVNSTDYTTQTYQTQSFAFYRDLTVGSEGADVSALQDYLIARGFLSMPAGTTKGYFGTLTQSAVARWQAAVGLTPAAGYFGQKSRTYISTGIIPASTTQTYVAPAKTTPAKTTVSAASCVNVTKTLTYEQSGSDVSKVQDFLEMKGLLTMPEGASKGTYGKLTATAIANYMATKGISTSGRVADESVLSQIRKDTGCAY